MDSRFTEMNIFFIIIILLSMISPSFGVHKSISLPPAPISLAKSSNTKNLIPAPAPSPSPKHHGLLFNHPTMGHHKALPPEAFPYSVTQPPTQDCDEISCSDPLTSTPIGSPCGCVYPMQLQIDLGVSPYQLFSRIADLEVDVAAGTFLKQSQVRIMGASASNHDPTKTTVTIDLVPLGEKFDKTTALLTYERFWQKKVTINMSLFGDYDVLYIHYPGLPFPSAVYVGSLGPSGIGMHQYPFSAKVPTTKSQKMDRKFIAITTLCVIVLVLACFGFLCILLKLKKYRSSITAKESAFNSSVIKKSGLRSAYSSSLASSSASFDATLAMSAPSVKSFSLSELEKATNKFSSNKLLGQGGFGRVYHGLMDDGSEVAIKLLTRENQYGDREFIAEVEMLSRLHHRNLVKLIGICIEGHTRCLIYELVRNGSLESHLHGVDKTKGPLDWEARMKIALGAARALAYLHEDSNPRVIHRDFKASNVLLEDDFTPKVSDFGLAREASEGIEHISTHVMGTFGYVAPEYAMTGHLLVKSDVYSYGVVLLELLSGRKPVYMSRPHRPENLVTWARPLLTSKEGLEQLIDPSLAEKYDFGSVAKVSAIASMCVHIEASQRPFMGEVVQALKLIFNDMDEVCDNSFSRKESLGTDYDLKGDFDSDSCWWNSATPPRLTFGCASSFVTMDYGSSPNEELQRPHSASTLVEGIDYLGGLNRSGPIRTKRKKQTFYRLQGSKSERGHPSRRFRVEGS